jgi:regulatory protein YycH of two-component signal transduction system YycFG
MTGHLCEDTSLLFSLLTRVNFLRHRLWCDAGCHIHRILWTDRSPLYDSFPVYSINVGPTIEPTNNVYLAFASKSCIHKLSTTTNNVGTMHSPLRNAQDYLLIICPVPAEKLMP